MKFARLVVGMALALPMSAVLAGEDDVLETWPAMAKMNYEDKALEALLAEAANVSTHLVKADAAKVNANAGVLSFELAPGYSVSFRQKDAYTTESGSLVWYGLADDRPGHGFGRARKGGEIDDDPLYSAMIVQNGETLTGNIRVDGRYFKLRPLHEGPHAIVEVDERLAPPDHPADYDEKAITVPMGPVVDGAKAISTIRVMVVYTSAAASASGNISSLIDLAVAETNKGYTNSGVEISLVLAGKYSTTYRETSSFSTDLSRFRGTTDGYMDSFHSTRNSIAADVGVLMINNASSCGLASGIGSTASTAFAAVHWDCATGYYSFGHEIGHLQSARHDPANDPTNSPYAYGHGYQYATGGWRTIMAYACSSGCTRLNYWSNPYKTYGGVPMGTTTRSHNQRVLQNTKATVAAFR